ncbi:hypothetical protein F5878DRAFT_36469 [Lentinula raphanica]|uniref:Uncharacterized protein n=1 Tax=Lentinula raphanica TaxID=153919 RepID=A0AA38UN15_9AGAR|nr:hypothetical protein F5878DRAFT_36469 [Lentinula raphanica]
MLERLAPLYIFAAPQAGFAALLSFYSPPGSMIVEYLCFLIHIAQGRAVVRFSGMAYVYLHIRRSSWQYRAIPNHTIFFF